ncbi:MAG: ABC transporter transmembrane domain-containing protein [Pseudomonadota bacterium]
MTAASNVALPMLTNLLSAAGWHGSNRRVFEAVPHMSGDLSVIDVLNTLDNLEIPTSHSIGSLHNLTAEDTPLLFIDGKQRMFAILEVGENGLLVAEPGKPDAVWKPTWRARGNMIRLERFDVEVADINPQNVFEFVREFSGMFPWLFVASLLTNVMGLASPLLIMVIYDQVIPSGSVHLAIALAFFMAAALMADFAFRMARARTIAHIGSETERKLSHALVRKIMSLQISQIEKTDVERQLARFKQFEALREAFTGQVLGSLLDLPFVLIFLAVIAWIAPPIFLLITALIVIFTVVAVASFPKQQFLNNEAARDKAALQAHVFETTQHQKDIQRLGLVPTWGQRNERLATRAASSGRKARQFQMVGQGLSQSLMAVAGVGSIAISTVLAIEGSMTFGALIAVMALVWKVLTPIVSLYSGAPQFFGYMQSRKQVDRVLALPEERVRGAGQSHQKKLKGQISVSNVTFRYSSSGAIALSQVNFDVEAEEFVCLAGETNSGKSTLMSLVAGLYQTSVGSISLDGIDIRQIAIDDLRQSVTYANGASAHFYGTIYQNFRLAAPDITEEETIDAIYNMGLKRELDAMEAGIHTRLTEAFRASMSDSTLRALALARSFARGSSLYMFNNPSVGLDIRRRAALKSCLADLHAAQKTVILATNDEDLMPLAKRFVFMQQGQIVIDDHGPGGLRKVKAILARNRS